MKAALHSVNGTMPTNAGIAIGPILFIIAILAILAAAIAAGSGSFTAGTSTESARTKASALIQIGENLKIGMDRVTMENGIGLSGVTIDLNSTSNNNDLFSPTGGGISAPSTAMANNPATDVWHFTQGALPGLGTTSPEEVAVLAVDTTVCDEINSRAGNGATPAVKDLGNFTSGTFTTSDWPFTGKTIGCVNNNDSGSTGFYFFQVLYVQ